MQERKQGWKTWSVALIIRQRAQEKEHSVKFLVCMSAVLCCCIATVSGEIFGNSPLWSSYKCNDREKKWEQTVKKQRFMKHFKQQRLKRCLCLHTITQLVKSMSPNDPETLNLGHGAPFLSPHYSSFFHQIESRQ